MRTYLGKEGDTRTVRKFLWFPLTIDRTRRWLETATWEEKCIKYYTDAWVPCYKLYFMPTRWLD